ncbi:killer cell lectin-like receptor 5 [Nannospalax galili]|uniref:killer cell lectin-like receptor 5 n=1 Tax=Nannospalax galili TaxID=1026970 RepID=UPI0004ED3301|nr:killer cell lectin-like receptor 5 [Nannospalax galili]
MSNQEVTYTTVRFLQSSSELQNRVRSGDIEEPREADPKECTVPWHRVAVALGVLCLLLLMAVVVVLVTQIQEQKKLQKILQNVSEEYLNLQNDMNLKEKKLENKSKEYESLKNLTEMKRCHVNNKITLNCLKSTGKRLEGHWFCCGTKCYYFIMDSKTWSGCTQTCRECSLTLLAIDDSDEQDRLRSQVNGNNYWIGLSYDKQEKEWKWIDSGSSNLDLTALNLQCRVGMCAFFTSTRIEDSDCGKTYPCICEKRMDMFSDSVCNKKESCDEFRQIQFVLHIIAATLGVSRNSV